MRTADLAYDIEIDCCGSRYHVRRTLDLARRVEQAAGAIQPLAERVERFGATQSELVTIYVALLREHPDRPSRGEIDAWVFAEGTHRPSRALPRPLMLLIIGNEALAEAIERAGRATEEAAPEKRPFSQAA